MVRCNAPQSSAGGAMLVRVDFSSLSSGRKFAVEFSLDAGYPFGRFAASVIDICHTPDQALIERTLAQFTGFRRLTRTCAALITLSNEPLPNKEATAVDLGAALQS